MTDCDAVLRRLWEFLDGELPLSEAERIRAHLLECAGCRPRYRSQMRFLVALARAHAGRWAPRPEFVTRLRAVLDASAPDDGGRARG